MCVRIDDIGKYEGQVLKKIFRLMSINWQMSQRESLEQRVDEVPFLYFMDTRGISYRLRTFHQTL